jgi:site-specific DNA recombinase
MANNNPPEERHQALTAIYVRVSSTGQLGRDGSDDGYSIPAQVQAVERKAADIGARVIKAYIERAESAKTDDRPVLQQMLRELPTLGVKYLIVHKVDRLARNRTQDGLLYERLVSMGITLVSATENIDETPAGRLMHGMLATFAEYYSNNLSTEIKKGLDEKHRQGGTPFKPPIGYRPKRELIAGQDIRSVEVDPERAPLVQRAFDLYATGNWSLSALVERLESDGLTTYPTPKRAPRTITKSHLGKILHNSYYVGIVKWRGKRVQGRHDALIDRETFDRVQALLLSRAQSGERPSKHEHYLRGSIFCAECGGRLLFGRHRGRGGVYEYFSCVNRATRKIGGTCHARHFPVDQVEQAIEDHYRTVRLSRAKQAEILADVRADAEERTTAALRDAERYEGTIRELEDNQQHLLQLAYKGLVDDEVLDREQRRLETEKNAAMRSLGQASAHAEDVEAHVAEMVAKAGTPHASYLASVPSERRMLNQTFFKQIFIGEDSEVVGVNLTPVYAAFGEWDLSLGLPDAQIVGRKPLDKATSHLEEGKRKNPGPSSLGQGSLFFSMVEPGGLEPPTSCMPCRRSPS